MFLIRHLQKFPGFHKTGMKKHVIIMFLLFLFYAAHARDKENPRPNILWIVSEDNSPLLGCYGDRYARTPRLDALAAEGILFEKAFSNAPVCAPSRSALITGVYPTTMGTEHMRSQYAVPGFIHLFPEYLRQAGYYTVNKAKTDYNMSPLEDRMEAAWDESSLHASYKHRKPGQPFFAMLNSSITHESAIHGPKDALPQALEKVPVPPYHPGTPEMEHDWARYYERVSKMDQWVGGILDELEKEGLADNTIVFYFSDHGGALGRGKRFLYESGLHVPLIIRVPKKLAHLVAGSAGERTDRLVSFIDFAPAVLSLAGVDVPEYMPGKPFLGDKPDKSVQYSFGFRGRMDAAIDLSRTVRNGRYRYIRNYMPHKIYGQYIEYLWKAASIPSWEKAYRQKQTNAAESAFWETKPFEELYDCELDPHNVHNLAGNEACKDILAELRTALDEWLYASVDIGFIPEPMMDSIAAILPLHEWARSAAYPMQKVLETASVAAGRDTRSLPMLMKRLRDKDPVVRYWAATGCRILSGVALPAKSILMEMSRSDKEVAVRNAAAEALFYLGEQKYAVALLGQAVSDKRLMVRVQALNALQTFGSAARSALPFAQKIVDAAGDSTGYDVSAARGLIRAMGR